ncbi:LOW QUALITY PROTEIN: peroxiredoxin-6 [Drosophila sulfurigaster albostrigata]|uniref:LOW QUALITY PROTEIN: peroxiredoxin-6 n=1 Tax=Drosophila sulfurigaster albostrigata TaxID=89887 RepID=UPI002D21C402|nr:LOW QUALITY PROTEIN: peroxiredoxin-6 [Drosophila sulfurigaster albostrigata]
MSGKALNIGDQFPNFQAQTNEGNIDFYEWMTDKWAILFSHPADFTPVCTTELSRVAQLIPEFNKRGVKPIALSCDTVESHKGWIEDIKSYAKLPSFDYPIIADNKRELALKLNMLDKDELSAEGIPLTCRAVFVVDDKKKLRLSILYPATTGRNFDEILRVIDSLQLTQTKSVATPADWKQGGQCMVLPTVKAEDVAKLFPEGVQTIEVPSGKSYLRITAQPKD